MLEKDKPEERQGENNEDFCELEKLTAQFGSTGIDYVDVRYGP